MKMKSALLALVLLLAAASQAQHLGSYSQYMFNGLLLNPAYAGSQEALNLTSLYRRQWLGLDGAPTTMNLTAHMPLRRKKAALGFLLGDDRFGVTEHTRAALAYAYRIRIGRGKLSLGLQGGVDVVQNNWNQIRTTQDRDPSFMVNAQRVLIPQLGCGVYYYAPRFFAGLSSPELLNRDNERFRTLTFSAGGVIRSGSNVVLKPVVLVRYIRHSPVDVNLSLIAYWHERLGIGMGYSSAQTAFAYLDLGITDQFYVGYAYDYTFSTLRNYNSGSHEIMLRYLFRYKIEAPSIRYF